MQNHRAFLEAPEGASRVDEWSECTRCGACGPGQGPYCGACGHGEVRSVIVSYCALGDICIDPIHHFARSVHIVQRAME